MRTEEATRATTSPVWIREHDIPVNGPRPRDRIDIKDLPFFDAARGVMLRAAIGVTTSAAYSPRHRHTFDQVRYFIKGRTKFGREVYGPGDCLYFPEGAFYGPQTSHEGEDCLHITAQFPGPSGIPYPNPEDQRRAVEELKAKGGTFEKGIYKHPGGGNQDGFEAVLEYLTGKPVTYPGPRIPAPVPMHGSHYRWRPLAGMPGVAVKHLGYFNETGPNIKLLKLECGARTAPSVSSSLQLRFVVEGAIEYAGEQFDAISCGYLPPGVPYQGMTRAGTDGGVVLLIQLAAPGGDPPPFCAL